MWFLQSLFYLRGDIIAIGFVNAYWAVMILTNVHHYSRCQNTVENHLKLSRVIDHYCRRMHFDFKSITSMCIHWYFEVKYHRNVSCVYLNRCACVYIDEKSKTKRYRKNINDYFRVTINFGGYLINRIQTCTVYSA